MSTQPSEIIFAVEEASKGGFVARTLGHSFSPKPTISMRCDPPCAMRSAAIPVTPTAKGDPSALGS
jgi:hypothetical protein